MVLNLFSSRHTKHKENGDTLKFGKFKNSYNRASFYKPGAPGTFSRKGKKVLATHLERAEHWSRNTDLQWGVIEPTITYA